MAVVLLAGYACASERPPWTVEQILRDVQPELQRFDGVTQPIAEAHIMMWQVERDPARDFVVEEALLWTRSDSHPQGESWALVHAVRHPAADNLWHRSVSYIETTNETLVPHTRLGYRHFQSRPSATDMCAFLLHIRGLGLDSGFKHVSGGFPSENWRKLTSGDTPCTFSGASAE